MTKNRSKLEQVSLDDMTDVIGGCNGPNCPHRRKVARQPTRRPQVAAARRPLLGGPQSQEG